MDPVSIVVAAGVAVVIVLQIMSLSALGAVRKKVDELEKRPTAPREFGDSRRDPRRDQRGRPREGLQDVKRPAPVPAPAAAVAPIDRSLRDINLRLKSAEQDQEKARKEVRGVGPAGPGGPGGDSQRRGGDRFRRGDQRPRRDDSRRPPMHGDRPRYDGPPRERPPAPLPQTDRVEAKPDFLAPPIAAPVETPAAIRPMPPQTPVPERQEEIEHGRKTIVRRRPLGAEPPGTQAEGPGTPPVVELGNIGSPAPAEPQPSPAPAESPVSTEASSSLPPVTEFGRR